MGRRYLVVDDHPIIQNALRETLSELEPDCEVRVTGRLADAMQSLRDGPVQLILFDLRLPDAGGVEGLVALRTRHPESPLAVMSAETDNSMITRCLDLGALGYIPKTLPADQMRSALRLVASGCAYVPPSVFAAEQPLRARPDAASVRSSDPRHLGLTDRQVDVLRLILRGLPNKLICRQLALAEGTVKVHVSAVLRALGVRNRTQAVIAASRIGLKLQD